MATLGDKCVYISRIVSQTISSHIAVSHSQVFQSRLEPVLSTTQRLLTIRNSLQFTHWQHVSLTTNMRSWLLLFGCSWVCHLLRHGRLQQILFACFYFPKIQQRGDLFGRTWFLPSLATWVSTTDPLASMYVPEETSRVRHLLKHSCLQQSFSHLFFPKRQLLSSLCNYNDDLHCQHVQSGLFQT